MVGSPKVTGRRSCGVGADVWAGSAGGDCWIRRGLSKREAEDVGEALRVAGSGAVADLPDAHGGLRAEAGSKGAEESRASGGDELFFDMRGVGGKAAEEVGGRGGGDGEVAVGAMRPCRLRR